MKKALIACAMVGMLAGCQNAGYIMETYNKVPKQPVKTASGTFWIFDRPDQGKILTTPTPGSMIVPAYVSGLTLGAAKLDPLVQAHQEVAREWFKKTGRSCEIKTSTEIWRPEYEHTYQCR